MRGPPNQITLEVRETSRPLPWPRAGTEAGKERGRRGEGVRAGRRRAGSVLHPSSAGSGAVTAAELLVILQDTHGTEQEERERTGSPAIFAQTACILWEFVLIFSTAVTDKPSVTTLCNASTHVDHSISSSLGHPGPPVGPVPITAASPSFPNQRPLPDGIPKGLPKEPLRNNSG